MKTGKKIIVTTMLAVFVLSFGGIAYAASDTGSAGALQDKDYTVEEMLTYALQDEYSAQAEYEAIIKEFGDQLPYTNLVNAEENHISRLVQLFQNYGYTVPENKATADVPKSLEESYQAGITTEENAVAKYDQFLKSELPSDVKLVFERLQKASENHLKALQAAADGNLSNYCQTNRANNGRGCGQSTGQCNGQRNGRGNGCGRMNGPAF